VAVGGVITFALSKASLTWIGFPFHPVGFALAMCYGVEYTWPSFLAMWLFKALLLRYGGLAMFQKFSPWFLGLTLGGLITPVCWGMVAWVFRWYS
jgi:chromate transport protein ChrA